MEALAKERGYLTINPIIDCLPPVCFRVSYFMAQGKEWYQKQLLDAKWIKKRDEILFRDRLCCRICGNGLEELHVHHLWYRSGQKPWEYGNLELRTLCKKHHDLVHNKDYMNAVRDKLIEIEVNDYMALFMYQAFLEKCQRILNFIEI